MNELGRLVAFLFLLGLLAGTACAEAGLALPRFVSLRSDEVNLRTGPGTNYPVEWVYVRRGLPVEIIAEFDNWRKVRDIEGTVGWIHKSLLSGKRMAVILGEEETRAPLRISRNPLRAPGARARG
jgi:SH3-like domain-containing protein